MSSEIPPNPITAKFNENAWIQAPLTNAIADRNYLFKIRPDTAGVLETFTAGILTDTINPISSTGTVAIGNVATNNVEIGVANGRSTILHIGDGNDSTGEIKIGSGDNSSGNVQILNGNYDGSTTAGDVNILNGSYNATSTAGNVYIQNNSCRGTCTIGNALSSVFIASASTAMTNMTASNPILVNYSALPSMNLQLGFRIAATLTGNTSITPTPVNTMTFTLPYGTWYVFAHHSIPNSNNVYSYSLSDVSATHQYLISEVTINGSTTGTAGTNLAGVVQHNTNPTKIYYAVMSSNNVTATTVVQLAGYAIRVA